MGSTYTDSGGIEKIGLGEQAGAWGTTTNNNFDIIDRLINGVGAITLSGTSHTLTTADGSLSDGMFKVLELGGSPSGTNTITIEPDNADKLYFVKNASGQTVTFTQGSGGDVSISNGFGAIIFADGAGSGAKVTDLTALFTTSQAIDGVNIGATTPGTGAFSALTVDNVVVNGANIGHTDDTDLITVASGAATIAGSLTTTGDILTSGTLKASGDTSTGQNAAIGFTSSEGIIITGQGSTNDVTIKNDADTTVIAIPTGGTGVSFAGTITTPSIVLGSTTITSTAAEINILDGVTASASEINILDGVTASTSELNIMNGVTATTAELNVLDGYTGSVTELNYLDALHNTGVTSSEFDFLDGVTSNIQTQLDAKAASITGAATNIHTSNLTASRALISNSSGKVAVSAVTSTEIGHLDGVTSNIQTQLDSKGTGTGTVTSVSGTDPIVSSGSSTTPAISLKNDFLQNTSSAVSTSTSASSFTNSSGYPVMFHAITNATSGGVWTITIGGSGHSYNTQDGTGDTSDTVAVFLPNGASISLASGTFKYFAVQMRPG